MNKKLCELRSRINIQIYYILLVLVKLIVYLIPKKKNSILLGAWFGNKYIDNTKYVYEYLLNDSKYKVCWYTKNKDIYNNLCSKSHPVVMANTLLGKWMLMRTKLFLSTVQMSEFNPMFISHSKYLDLGHGHPIKDCGDIVRDPSIQFGFKMSQLFIDYYKAACSELSAENSIKVHNTPAGNVRYANFARNDFFFDKTLQPNTEFNIPYKYIGKTIVYMPTHRSEGHVEIDIPEILDLQKINIICEETDSVFIIKKHYYHRNEVINLKEFPRIFDFTNEPFDPQFFLLKADILITDYSACYVDYLLLDRPIIFYHYDFEDFQKNERSLLIPFETINIGPKPRNKFEFNSALLEELFDTGNRYSDKRKEFMSVYFKKPYPHHGRKDVKAIIDELLEL